MIKSGRHIFIVLILSAPFCAIGGTCPEGWSALTHDKTVLAPVCSNDSTDLGPVIVKCDTNSATCSPDVACGTMKVLHAGDNVSVPLYSVKYSTPALNVAQDDVVCYANLIPGSAANAINVSDGNSTWHTAGLRRCLELSANVVPTITTPESNAVVWRGVSGTAKLIGTSHCSATSGSAGSVQTALNITSTDASKYCWCRLRRPATSKWVYAETYSGIGACNTSCAIACANAFAGDSTFRGTIIGSIK